MNRAVIKHPRRKIFVQLNCHNSKNEGIRKLILHILSSRAVSELSHYAPWGSQKLSRPSYSSITPGVGKCFVCYCPRRCKRGTTILSKGSCNWKKKKVFILVLLAIYRFWDSCSA